MYCILRRLPAMAAFFIEYYLCILSSFLGVEVTVMYLLRSATEIAQLTVSI